MAHSTTSVSQFQRVKSNDRPIYERKDPFLSNKNKRASNVSSSSRTDLSTLPTFRQFYEKSETLERLGSLDEMSSESGGAKTLTTVPGGNEPIQEPLKQEGEPRSIPPTVQASTYKEKPETAAASATTNVSEKRKSSSLLQDNEIHPVPTTPLPASMNSSKPTSVPSSKPASAPSSKPPSVPTSKPTSAPSSKPPTAPSSKPPTAPSSKPPSVSASKQPSAPSSKPPSVPASKPVVVLPLPDKTTHGGACKPTPAKAAPAQAPKPGFLPIIFKPQKRDSVAASIVSFPAPIPIPISTPSKPRQVFPSDKTLVTNATRGSTRPPSTVSEAEAKSIKTYPEESEISSAMGLNSETETNISLIRRPSAAPLTDKKCRKARRVNAYSRDINENPGFVIGPPLQYRNRKSLVQQELQKDDALPSKEPATEYRADLGLVKHRHRHHRRHRDRTRRNTDVSPSKLEDPENSILEKNQVPKTQCVIQKLPSKESVKNLESDIETILKTLDNPTNKTVASTAVKIISEFYGIPQEYAISPKSKSRRHSRHHERRSPTLLATFPSSKDDLDQCHPATADAEKSDDASEPEHQKSPTPALIYSAKMKLEKLESEPTLEIVNVEHRYKVDKGLLLDNKDLNQTIENRETKQTVLCSTTGNSQAIRTLENPSALESNQTQQSRKSSSIANRSRNCEDDKSAVVQQSRDIPTTIITADSEITECQNKSSTIKCCETKSSQQISARNETQLDGCDCECVNTSLLLEPDSFLPCEDGTSSSKKTSAKNSIPVNDSAQKSSRKYSKEHDLPPPRPAPPLTRSRIRAMPEPHPRKIPSIVEPTDCGQDQRNSLGGLMKRAEVDYYFGDPKGLNEREAKRRPIKYAPAEMPSQPPGSIPCGDAPPVPPRSKANLDTSKTTSRKHSGRHHSSTERHAPLYYAPQGKSKVYPGNNIESKVTFSESTAQSPVPQKTVNSVDISEIKDSEFQQVPHRRDSTCKPQSSRVKIDGQTAIKSSKMNRVPRASDDPCYVGSGSIFWAKENPEPVKWFPLTVITTRKIKNLIISDLEDHGPAPNFRYPGVVEEMHIDGVITQENFLNLLHQLYELKTLEIHITSLHSLSLDKFNAGSLELPNLKSLEISSAAFVESDALEYNLSRILANLIFLLGLIFPSLSYLGIAFPFVPDLEFEVMSAVWKCILHHRETLKLFNIECPFVEPQPFGKPIRPQITSSVVEMDLKGSDQVNLLSFHLFYSTKVGSTEFWRRFLKTQGHLQYIQFWCEGPFYYKFPYDIIKKNYYQLQTVSMNVDIQSYPDRQNKVPIDCSIFKGMPFLKTLALKGFLLEHQNPRDLLRPDLINVQGLAPRMETIKIMNLNIDQTDLSKMALENNLNLKTLYLDNIGTHGNLGLALETLVSLLQRPCGNIQKVEVFDSFNRKSLEKGSESPRESLHLDKGYRLIAKILTKKESRPSFRAYRTINNDFEIFYEDDEKQDISVNRDEWVDQELKTKSSISAPGTKRIVSSLMKPGLGRTGTYNPAADMNNGRSSISSDDSRKPKYRSKSIKKLYSNKDVFQLDSNFNYSKKRLSTDSSASRRKSKSKRLVN